MLGNGRAVRIWHPRPGVYRLLGRHPEGDEKTERPDWHPPPEMIERQPYLPRFMAGGDGNPLLACARSISVIRCIVHSRHQPAVHYRQDGVVSGCFWSANEDVNDLFERVKAGARVVVIEGAPRVLPSARWCRSPRRGRHKAIRKVVHQLVPKAGLCRRVRISGAQGAANNRN